MSGLVRSTVSSELSSRTFEPSSSGCMPLMQQFQPRQIARVGMKHAVGPAGGGADVAMAVEHGEGIAMLERAARPRRGTGRRNVERSFRNRVDEQCRRSRYLSNQLAASDAVHGVVRAGRIVVVRARCRLRRHRARSSNER